MTSESSKWRSKNAEPQTIDWVLVKLGQTLVKATFDRVFIQRGIREPYWTEQFNVKYAAPNQKVNQTELIQLKQDTQAIRWNERAYKLAYRLPEPRRMTLTVPGAFADEHQQALSRFIRADNAIPEGVRCSLREDPNGGRLLAFDRIDSEMPLHPIATAVAGLLTLDRRLNN